MRKRQICNIISEREKGTGAKMREERERRKDSGGEGERREVDRERRQGEWKTDRNKERKKNIEI